MSSEPTDERQRLEINDARPIRALAHPARIAALTHLMHIGPATATELGEVVGLSPSAMSYHLRLLETAGMVEPAPTRGDGRERVWQSPHSGLNLDTDTDADPDLRQASIEFLEAFILSQEMRARRYLSRAQHDAELLDQGYLAESVVMVTKDEMAELNEKLQELIRPYVLSKRSNPPAEARRTSLIYRAFPLD